MIWKIIWMKNLVMKLIKNGYFNSEGGVDA